MGKRSNGGSRRFALQIVCIALGLILAAMVIVTLFFRHMMGKINYVRLEEHHTLSQEELDAFLSEEPQPPDTNLLSAPSETTQPITEAPERDVIQLLLIGQDRREGEKRARSDSMILCTFRKDTGTLYLTSILRDLYVQIPGYRDNRLNAAYAAGGMKLLDSTLEHNFGIRVDGNLEVDFTRFSGVVDLLGGVTIVLREDEAALLNKTLGCNLSEGENLLTGEQALYYSRIRSLDPDGDFSRTGRQRNVITAMVEACRSASLFTLLSLLEEVLPMITTDLTGPELVSIATELFPMLPDLTIVSQRLPADGTYTCQTIRDMAVLVADMDAARELVKMTLPEEKKP